MFGSETVGYIVDSIGERRSKTEEVEVADSLGDKQQEEGVHGVSLEILKVHDIVAGQPYLLKHREAFQVKLLLSQSHWHGADAY